MMQLPSLNKKILFIIGGVLLLIVPLSFLLMAQRPSQQNTPTENITNVVPSPNTTEPKTIDDFVPGQTTYDKAISVLGKPTKVIEKGKFTILYYPAPGVPRYSKVYLDNDVVEYTIKEIADKEIYPAYLEEHPTVEGALYNLYENNEGYNLYVFASQGLAFLVYEPSKYTAEVHRFAPTTKDTYFQTFAPELTYE